MGRMGSEIARLYPVAQGGVDNTYMQELREGVLQDFRDT
jgi:hypothetical protein